MLFLSLASTIYYCLITVGILAASAISLRRISFFKNTGTWQLVLPAAGIFPALVSISGFTGINRLLPLPQICGAAAALFALYIMYKNRVALFTAMKGSFATWPARLMISVGALFLIVQGAVQWCALYGGINNFDQFRGFGFTSGFAANYLKAAHPLDLSIPVSYGYYFYEYTAFLYAAVNGNGWPSVALLVCATLSIFTFYFAFLQLTRRLVPSFTPMQNFIAICALSFYGLDFLSLNPYQGDWWNFYQITQMAAYWTWLYHYLFAAALALAALACLHDALEQRHADTFFLSLLLILIVPLYAAVTGLFFGCVFVLALVLALLRDRKILALLRFDGKSLQAVFLLIAAAVISYLPQLYTFWGREGYLTLHQPVLWFTQKEIVHANWADWRESLILLGAELGALHVVAFLLAPLCVYSLFRQKPVAAVIVASLSIAIIMSLSFVSAPALDWYWRSGNFGIIILTAIVATWMFSLLPRETDLKSCALWCMALLFFLPGAWNFYSESMKRYLNCHPAPQATIEINRTIGLHTAIGYSGKERAGAKPQAYQVEADHPWQQAYFHVRGATYALHSEQDAILTLANQAGRVAIAAKNPLWNFLDVYALPADFLDRHFQWKKETDACGKTGFGASIPQDSYAKINSLNPLQTEMRTCGR